MTPKPKKQTTRSKPRVTPRARRRFAEPRLLERIVDDMNSALIVVELPETIIVFNSMAERITGYPRDEVLGKNLTAALGPENRDVLVMECTRDQSPFENRDTRFRTRDGKTIPIGFTRSALRETDGRVAALIFLFKDLSEILQMREEMKHRSHLAVVGEMTAGIAHEIKNPLAAMLTAVEALKDELDYDEVKLEYIERITAEIRRVNSMVNDFLMFARPRSLAPVSCDVHDILDILLFVESEKVKRLGIHVSRVYGRDIPPSMLDRDQIKQAFLNLLLNAFQAAEGGGRVTLRTALCQENSRQFLRVEISDTGVGIPEDQRERVFQPFFSTRAKGIGLGLPITERIVREHGGFIRLSSTVGKGSTFSVFLPATPGRDA